MEFPRSAQTQDAMGASSNRKSIFGTMGQFGQSIMGKVGNFFSGAEDDDAPPVVFNDLDVDEGIMRNNPVKGFGYNLSYCYYQDPGAHSKNFFFTSPLGDPFPSYQTSPTPDFPARWTLVPNIRMPCESLTAPRIRLAPAELKERQKVLQKMREAASKETNSPKPHCLNLAHQCLGDPYQYEAFVTFWDINNGARVLSLIDNELDDITDLDLSSVRKLYLSRNNFATFEMIPACSNLEELYLNENFITGLRGLTESRFPKLRKLEVKVNPLEEMGDEYKTKIRKAIPTLEWLNGTPVDGWQELNG